MKKIQTLISRVVIGSMTLLLGLSMVPAAHAQYPGVNGRIVFSSPAGYLTVRPDSTNLHALGTAVTGCYSRTIVYNPAGTQMAYTGIATGNTDGDIFLQNSTFTATAQQLTNDPATNDCDPYFSPDGTRIVFARQTGSAYEVWVMNSNGTSQTRLTNNLEGDGGSDNPVWLNANTIFVNNGGNIVSIDSTTANQATGTTIYNGTTIPARAFDISPASNQIVFDATGGIYTCVLTATCTAGTQIIAPGAAGITQPANPAYSPDGTRIVFVGSIPGQPSTQSEGIFIANTNGTGITQMTFNSGGFQALAYTTYQPYWGTNNDTFTTPGDGGTTGTPGVPNTTATKAEKNSPTPWILGGLMAIVMLGLGGFWVKKELKGKK